LLKIKKATSLPEMLGVNRPADLLQDNKPFRYSIIYEEWPMTGKRLQEDSAAGSVKAWLLKRRPL
jgi:hypothetical protein